MARPFSYPDVTSLEVGQSCTVQAPVSEAKRKVTLYSARKGRRFEVTNATGPMGGLPFARVTRLPDPEPRAE